MYLDYFSLPLFASGHIALLNNKVNLFGKVGYGASLLIQVEQEWPNPLIEGEFIREKMRSFRGINNLDHGIHLGGGIDIPIKVGEIRIESEYYIALRNVIGFFSSKNRGLNLNIGYSLDL